MDSRSAELSIQETEATGSRLIILRKNERQELEIIKTILIPLGEISDKHKRKRG